MQTQKPDDRYTAEERRRYGDDVPGLDGALVDSCLTSLPVGQVCPAITEDRHALKIVRLVARAAGEYQIEAGIIRKRTFAEWFPDEAKKVPVEWRDPSVRIPLGAPRVGGLGGHR
jgi:hypothetical protein